MLECKNRIVGKMPPRRRKASRTGGWRRRHHEEENNVPPAGVAIPRSLQKNRDLGEKRGRFLNYTKALSKAVKKHKSG